MDGTTKTVLADSSTTAKELSQMLCEKVGITDTFGFSLFIALFDKVMSIGNTNEHVLDAISSCEQYAKELGSQERVAPWRLFFKKEIFTPWHDTKEDRYATNMTYNQVIRGVKFGEYRYEDDEGYAGIAAKQWYIDFGQEIMPGKLNRLVSHYIPEREIEDDDETRNTKYWADLIIKEHRNSKQVRQRWEPLKVKQDIVHSARFQWPLLFSRFYEVKYLTSTAANMPVKIKSGDNIILAVTWTKIFMVDYKEKIIGDFTYPEITNINCNRDDDGQVTSFYISTIQNDEYSLSSPESEDIRDLVTGFLDGLKRRSKYAVAMQGNPNKISEGSQFLKFDKGDLLVLEKPWGKLQKMGQAWSFGTNAATKQSGDFPMDCVYVLPALTKPPKETLDMFLQKNDLEDIKRVKQTIEDVEDDGTSTIDGLFTLESYCRQYCRESLNESGLFSGKRNEMPWEFTKDPIKHPMLKGITENEDLAHEATDFFQAIMKYMGDYPSKRPRGGNELTDLIFSKPLQSEVLRDELYLHLCKQLTKNPSDLSEERGWELLWLSCGLFAPSTTLLPHVNKFIATRKDNNPMAQDCSSRLQKTLRVGDRKFAPHLVEVEAIQNKTTQIFHKVYFPDDTDEAFEVESSTRAKDFCQGIANRLRLKSSEGFSLFVKIIDKVIAVPTSDFFFDFVRHLTDLIKSTIRRNKTALPQLTYQVFYMKKLWSNTVPGKDHNADNIFHYHQELPKYLRGYHKVGKHEASEIAALIYRVRFGEDKTNFANIPRMMRDLVPMDVAKTMAFDDWKRSIIGKFNMSAGKSKEEAKLAFLKVIYRWPTFGSAFFEIQQHTDQTLPEQLIVAVNKSGINLIDHETKEIIAVHAFRNISNWTSGNTYFNLTIGTAESGQKLLLETNLGYKMDDLLTSYINFMMTSSKQKSRKL